jgi:hypothetical protein
MKGRQHQVQRASTVHEPGEMADRIRLDAGHDVDDGARLGQVALPLGRAGVVRRRLPRHHVDVVARGEQ